MVQLILVDDDTSVLNALQLLIRSLGYEVTSFSSAEKALHYLQNANSLQEITHILCDLRMPGMDGLELLRRLRDSEIRIPFILFSGHATDSDIEELRKFEACQFLPKPFEMSQLIAALGRSVGTDRLA